MMMTLWSAKVKGHPAGPRHKVDSRCLFPPLLRGAHDGDLGLDVSRTAEEEAGAHCALGALARAQEGGERALVDGHESEKRGHGGSLMREVPDLKQAEWMDGRRCNVESSVSREGVREVSDERRAAPRTPPHDLTTTASIACRAAHRRERRGNHKCHVLELREQMYQSAPRTVRGAQVRDMLCKLLRQVRGCIRGASADEEVHAVTDAWPELPI